MTKEKMVAELIESLQYLCDEAFGLAETNLENETERNYYYGKNDAYTVALSLVRMKGIK